MKFKDEDKDLSRPENPSVLYQTRMSKANVPRFYPVRVKTETSPSENQDFFLYRGRVYTTSEDGQFITLIHPSHQLTMPIIIFDDGVLLQYAPDGQLTSVDTCPADILSHAAGKFIRFNRALLPPQFEFCYKASQQEEEASSSSSTGETTSSSSSKVKPNRVLNLEVDNLPQTINQLDVFVNKEYVLVTDYDHSRVKVFDSSFLYTFSVPKPIKILSYARKQIHVLGENQTYYIFDIASNSIVMTWQIPFPMTQITSNGQDIYLLDAQKVLHIYQLTKNSSVRGVRSSFHPAPLPTKKAWGK
jgi:hypothetical protein